MRPAAETGFPFWSKSFQKENFSGKKENRNEKQAEKGQSRRPGKSHISKLWDKQKMKTQKTAGKECIIIKVFKKGRKVFFLKTISPFLKTQ